MQDREITLEEFKQDIINEINRRNKDGILETENATFLIKLIKNADNKKDILKISALGTMYKKTGFHFDVRLEKNDGKTINYLSHNKELSFFSGGGLHTN